MIDSRLHYELPDAGIFMGGTATGISCGKSTGIEIKMGSNGNRNGNANGASVASGSWLVGRLE